MFFDQPHFQCVGISTSVHTSLAEGPGWPDAADLA